MSYQNVINNAILAQDIELASYVNELKNNPQKLQTFLANEQARIISSVKKQKEDTFNKVYGDVQRSEKIQESILKYKNRSKELSQLHDNIYDNQKDTADSIVHNKNTNNRKYEMNEWTVNNKKDTLFVLSSLFIGISVFLLLTILLHMHIISTGIWAFIGAITVIVFILIVINRAQYTDLLRNKHYWNKKRFEGENNKIVSICPTPAPAPTAPTASTASTTAASNAQ
jgi:cation transport ATPase